MSETTRLIVSIATKGSASRCGLGVSADREQRPQDNLRNVPLEEFLRAGDLEAYRAIRKRRPDR